LNKKRVKVIEIVGILKVFLFTALDLMTIHGAVVMDFLFIQPFGWIRIIIARGEEKARRIRVIYGLHTLRGVKTMDQSFVRLACCSPFFMLFT
jgi:hypothetical protein